MTATSVVLIFIGIFVVINAGNFVQVINGKLKIGANPPQRVSEEGTIGTVAPPLSGGGAGSTGS